MKTKRSEVYAVIDGERNYQDNLGCDRTEHCNEPLEKRTHSTAEYITMLHTYINQANDAWTKQAGDTAALHEIRKVAAIAVHCMEDNGAPIRLHATELAADVDVVPVGKKMFFKKE